jgi:hypothetical protein
MGKLISTFLLIAFMLVSALANLGSAHASSDEPSAQTMISAALIKSETTPAPSSVPTGDDPSVADKIHNCPCEKDQSSSKYVCGVTLALSNNTAALHTPTPSKARFVSSRSARILDFVDLLKRPPRTIL